MPTISEFELEEQIESFTFREKGGIKILKKWREVAVICQVDVEIVSVARDQYLNFASTPAGGFYGYATLVMRDFAIPSIKLTQPRQTIYIARNEFALSAWQLFDNQLRVSENFQGIEQLVCFNTGLLGGACVSKPCKGLPEPSFDEFPLRQVFIESHYGTQFNVEYSFFFIKPFLNNCGDIVSPKSRQTDGDKDNGLPPDGVQPQKAPNPSNPYAGLPSPSPDSREGVIPQSESNDMDNPNPNNSTTTPKQYILTFQGDALSAEDVKFTGQGTREITYAPSQSITLELGALIYTRPQDGSKYYYCRLLIDGVFVDNVAVSTPYPAGGFSSACTIVSLNLK